MSKFYGAILEPYGDDLDYEDFLYDLGYFEKYLGKEVFVQGKNLDWRGSCGEMTFILEDIKQIFEKLNMKPETVVFKKQRQIIWGSNSVLYYYGKNRRDKSPSSFSTNNE